MPKKIAVADRYVQAKHDDWGFRRGPVLGFVLHMAEGYNVWRYLAYGNVLRNVSVHFTIERDGEIVQMLGLDRISGSINPNTIRKDDDANGHYGYSHNKAVMDGWWYNPNHAVITVEVAGYAKDGPNDAQVDSIERLFAYLSDRYPDMKPLGHRDFQNVKPCPGQVFWYKVYHRIGGHGKDHKGYIVTGSDGEDDKMIRGNFERTSSKYIELPTGVQVYDAPDGDVFRTTRAQRYDFMGYAGSGWWAIEIWNKDLQHQVIAYIKKGSYEIGDWPEEPVQQDPDIEELQARITTLESALQVILETSETALVDPTIDPNTGEVLR